MATRRHVFPSDSRDSCFVNAASQCLTRSEFGSLFKYFLLVGKVGYSASNYTGGSYHCRTCAGHRSSHQGSGTVVFRLILSRHSHSRVYFTCSPAVPGGLQYWLDVVIQRNVMIYLLYILHIHYCTTFCLSAITTTGRVWPQLVHYNSAAK